MYYELRSIELQNNKEVMKADLQNVIWKPCIAKEIYVVFFSVLGRMFGNFCLYIKFGLNLTETEFERSIGTTYKYKKIQDH